LIVRVAGGLIVKAGAVLLGRRAPHKRICPSTWDLIGGHLEPGESPAEALVRELYEEIDIRPTRFFEINVIDFSEEAGRSVHYHLFRVDGFTGAPRIANLEHTALRWFGWDEALALCDLASDRYRSIFETQRKERNG
jgi:8-oxo-dGTP diphosphatase